MAVQNFSPDQSAQSMDSMSSTIFVLNNNSVIRCLGLVMWLATTSYQSTLFLSSIVMAFWNLFMTLAAGQQFHYLCLLDLKMPILWYWDSNPWNSSPQKKMHSRIFQLKFYPTLIFKHSDWLIKFFNQSQFLKIA